MTLSHLTLSDLERSSKSHSDFEWYQICMVYIYLPAVCYHINVDVTKESLLAHVGYAAPVVVVVNI